VTAGLITAALVLVIGAAVLWFARKAGRDSVRADNAAATIKAVKVSNEVHSEVAGMPAADRERERMRWTKPGG
jgi:multidrug resistance efflux pump